MVCARDPSFFNDKPLKPDVEKDVLKKILLLLKYSYRSVVVLFYPAAWVAAAALYWVVERENTDNDNSNKIQADIARPLRLHKDWLKSKLFWGAGRLDMTVIQYLVNEFELCISAEESGGIAPPNSLFALFQPNRSRHPCSNASSAANKKSLSDILKGETVVSPNTPATNAAMKFLSARRDANPMWTHESTKMCDESKKEKEGNAVHHNNAKHCADSSTCDRQSSGENLERVDATTLTNLETLNDANNRLHPKHKVTSDHPRKRKLLDVQNEHEHEHVMDTESKGSLKEVFLPPLKKTKKSIPSAPQDNVTIHSIHNLDNTNVCLAWLETVSF
ncbi:hypothetical protein RFI_13971 [Reticulomyxa filosa]|uniref:Uncharacterized protein n=1 Tax=Reticulomyxa filosa TaxID=46433 RepID=X6NBE4_RETFI|nr:hypothetical protein RFI_13971 [Reticulomyxa filosa]|eukprot:ETO23218.1 hypothetical protein RFI_13971 [Reticulomyxa filosa]